MTMRIDVEGLLVRYLRSKSFNASGDAGFAYSPHAPARFLTVERTGGTMDADGVADNAAIVIQAWAQSRGEAMHLAIAADSVMLGFEQVDGIYRVNSGEMVNFPPLDGTRRGRYQLSYTITTYDG
jgi:hypothetical protein